MDGEMMENMEAFRIPDETVEKLRDPDVLKRYIEEGKTFQDIIGYNDEMMEKLYRAGYSLFQQKRFQDAADGFTFLTTMNPYVHNYWIGLGMSEQMLENYEAALVAYGMAVMTDVDSVVPHYHCATCYYLLGDYSSALHSLDQVLERAGNSEEAAAYKQDAQRAREKILRLK